MAGRKEDLIIRIRLHRSIKGGLSVGEAIDSTKGYFRKTVADLQEIYSDDLKEFEERDKKIWAISEFEKGDINAIQEKIQRAMEKIDEAENLLIMVANEAESSIIRDRIKVPGRSLSRINTALFELDSLIGYNKRLE
jgi:cell division FtsZ-interacting protein ZapD